MLERHLVCRHQPRPSGHRSVAKRLQQRQAAQFARRFNAHRVRERQFNPRTHTKGDLDLGGHVKRQNALRVHVLAHHRLDERLRLLGSDWMLSHPPENDLSPDQFQDPSMREPSGRNQHSGSRIESGIQFHYFPNDGDLKPTGCCATCSPWKARLAQGTLAPRRRLRASCLTRARAQTHDGM